MNNIVLAASPIRQEEQYWTVSRRAEVRLDVRHLEQAVPIRVARICGPSAKRAEQYLMPEVIHAH